MATGPLPGARGETTITRMKRTLAHRLAALGLVAMFQVGAMPSLEHVACISVTMASHDGAIQGMHAGHQDESARHPMAGHAGHSTDDGAPNRDAPCCCDGPCVCPMVQPAFVQSGVTSGPLGELGVQDARVVRNAPTCTKAPFLLPFANAPPVA